MSDEPGWGARIRAVGDALLAVVRAEVAALATDLGRSGQALLRALVWVGALAAFGFWTLGLFLYLAIELLTLVVPRVGAVAIVFGLFAIVSAILVAVVRRRFAAIEPPAATVRRRMGESQRWWRERVAPDELLDPAEALDSEASGRGPADGRPTP